MSSVLNKSEVALVLIMSEPGGGAVRSRIQEILHPRHPHGIVSIEIFCWWYIKRISIGDVGRHVMGAGSAVKLDCLLLFSLVT
jgi:hypothetical protein